MDENNSIRKRNLSVSKSCEYQESPIVGDAEYQIIEAPDWEAGLDIAKSYLVRSTNRRLLHWGPFTAITITLIIGIATTIIHLQWWPLKTIGSLLNLSLFLFFNYLTLINLSKSANIGPGYVPLSWFPPNKEDEARLQYCRVCEGFKAPRSHHCSKCDRCVFKMDHHCPWINNCVGHYNHALFVRFLAAAVVGCIHSAIILGSALYRFFFRMWYLRYGDGTEPIVLMSIYLFIFSIFAFGLALGVIISVGFLLFVQIRAILRNRTGIEDYIVDKANARERDSSFIYPYNLGWRRNVREVLGSWNAHPKTNGIWWPIRYPCTQFTFSEEQLLQKKNKRDNAYDVVIARSFGGGYCASIKLGLKIFVCQPWNEEKRVEVKVGERWLVTRVHRHWLYGFQMNDYDSLSSKDGMGDQWKENIIHVRGWFPRICALKS